MEIDRVASVFKGTLQMQSRASGKNEFTPEQIDLLTKALSSAFAEYEKQKSK